MREIISYAPISLIFLKNKDWVYSERRLKMTTIKHCQRLIFGALGILSLMASLGDSGRAIAAQATADVSVTIVADSDKAKLGQHITYTVTATNLGPDAALFVDVVHGLSDQLAIISLTCDRGISPDGPFCEYSILEPGESVVSTLVATSKSDAQTPKSE
jgi:uncharacterized repeat protein (TIGR01451 family)